MKQMLQIVFIVLLLISMGFALYLFIETDGGRPYYIYPQTTTGYIFCRTFDVEQRIGYDCTKMRSMDLGVNIEEYHLGPLDSWAKAGG